MSSRSTVVCGNEEDVTEQPDPNDDKDIMKILIATDIHVGYKETDPIMANDSINTFEEILQIADEKEVDFILLAGDLFHINKPSKIALHGVMTLLRKYCMGRKPCQVEFLSDQSVNFSHTPFSHVNYEDDNLNIAIPVFSIHGNLDDPGGHGTLSPLDILSVSGLVNYFGKYTDLDKIKISPILMQKGKVKLCLYGLGSISDEHLHRLFVHNKVCMVRPLEVSEEWFNMFVIHQNRAKRSPTNYIPEQFLGDFLDLVIWGHEHECRIDPICSTSQKFSVCQPGSSIVTSLKDGEKVPKHVGVLRLWYSEGNNKPEFDIEKVPLQTVRQFYMEDIILQETSIKPDDLKVKEKVEALCTEKVNSMLAKAAATRSGHKDQPKEPVIHLRVDYSGGFTVFSQYRFAQNYVGQVANLKTLIKFTRQHETKGKSGHDGPVPGVSLKKKVLDCTAVEDMVKQYFSGVDDKGKMSLLTQKGLGDAAKKYVDKQENKAIEELVKCQLEKMQDHLKSTGKATEELIEKEILKFKREQQQGGEEAMEGGEALGDDLNLGNDDNEEEILNARGRGRGRGRGRARGAAAGGRGSGGGRVATR